MPELHAVKLHAVKLHAVKLHARMLAWAEAAEDAARGLVEKWLYRVCGGALFHGVQEDLEEHWEEGAPYRSFWLGRVIVEMKWRNGASRVPGSLPRCSMPDPAQRVPSDFSSWEECRDFYALEAIFLGQMYDRSPTPSNRRRYMQAAAKARAANLRCAEPLPEETA